jgi:exosortase
MSSNNSQTRTVLLWAAAILIGVLFFPALKYAWHKWGTDPNYEHAYFVPVGALYLVWKQRAALKAEIRVPSATGFAFVVPAVILHILANNAGLHRFSLVAFDATLAGAVVLFFGWGMLRQVLFPLVFLLFAVPIPLYLESTTLPMKLMASAAAVKVLSLLGQTVYREGTIIHLSSTTLEVATACSGLRSLVLVCTVGAFYAYTLQRPILRRWTVFLASVPIALGANVTRIIVTAVLWDLDKTGSLQKFIHDFSGVFVFLVSGALFVFTALLVDLVADRLLCRGAKAPVGQQEVERCSAS